MISELVSSAVDLGFEPPSGQTKTLKLVFAVFLVNTQHLGVRVKDCLARNQDNVSEWSNMSTRGLLFQWASTLKIQLNV
jgi:hypothetical protein